MNALGLKFRVDDVVPAGRRIEGTLSMEILNGCLPGLIGDLGFRPTQPAVVTGNVYRSGGTDIVLDGQISVVVGFDCSRCLSERSAPFEFKMSHVLSRRKAPKDGVEEIVITEEDGDDLIETYHGDEVDIHDLVRQDLLLSLPMNPSCETAQASDCTYDENRAQSDEESIDPRWAPLLELKKKLN